MLLLKPEDKDIIQNLAKSAHEQTAFRIGNKIREIREFRGLSLTELGEKVGINADMMQKYENGTRKPKPDRIIDIARALDVTPLAISEPSIETPLGVMYTLFDLERTYGLSLFETDGESIVSISSKSFKNMGYLNEWIKRMAEFKSAYNSATSEQEQEQIIKDYKQWKWSFPFSASEEKTPSEIEDRKSQLKNSIEALQRELNELESIG